VSGLGHGRRAATAAILLALVPACRDAAAPAPPPPPALPPLALSPRLPQFTELARTAPAAPDAAELRRTMALLEPAFVDLGDERLTLKSKNALRSDPLAGPALEAALLHDDAAIRAGAAFELGGFDRPAALVPLLKRLKYEPDATVRVWVADALARRGCGGGLGVLVDAIKVAATADLAGQRAVALLRTHGHELPEPATWEAIEDGLRRLQRRWRTTGTMATADGDGSRPAGSADDPALRGRLAELMCALEGFQLRPVDDARFMLARAGALALPFLRPALTASEQYLRTHTLEVVRDLGPAAAELGDEILPLLADPLSRTDAAQALAAVRARTAVPHLLAWLRGGDAELRAAAARALGPLGDRSTLPELRARMEDEGEAMDVRVMAAYSVALFEVDRPGYRFLLDLRDRGGYHAPTLAELIDQVDRHR
jgi:HEAT repeat protein